MGVFPGGLIGIEKGCDGEEKEIITLKAKKMIIATGASENVVRFKGWTTPGVMGSRCSTDNDQCQSCKAGEEDRYGWKRKRRSDRILPAYAGRL